MKDQDSLTDAVDKPVKRKSIVREYAESIIFALILALILRTYVVQSFKIPSGSMENTLAIGDHILTNKFIFGTKIPFSDKKVLKIRDPRQDDVIVFRSTDDPDKDLIKRVIGTPGDRVRIVNKQVYVNGKPYVNPHEIHRDSHVLPREQGMRDNTGTIIVPPNSYFVMGDNRDNSYDSRFWGFVDKRKIKALAFVKYWSWDEKRSRVRWGSIGTLIK